MRIWGFFILFFLAGNALAAPTVMGKKKTEMGWSAVLYGRSTDDDLSSARVVGVKGLFHVAQNLSDSWSAVFTGGAAMETGSSSSLFTDEFAPTSRILLGEASLNWHPGSVFGLRAGALPQTEFSPLLIYNNTFPAGKMELNANPGGPWVLQGNAQGAIPTSQRLATKSTGKEATPFLLTQNAKFGFAGRGFSLIGSVTHFDFRNLTHGMAQDSRYYGNSISGVAAGSAFLYEFEGYEGGLTLAADLGGSLSTKLGAFALRNQRGPIGNNQGGYAFAELKWSAESFSLRPRAEVYREEADAAPAFYTSAEFGHNNRKGMGASLQLELKDPRLSFEVRARESKVIQPATFQRDKFKYIELLVGIPYASF